ncbi:hypothetical protein E6O75_ATG11285 [Venturia nashicola]|uniref:Uncharacterized protein n=1 Tax=Venturia nashicola TaxID=86259 RepID=A0A4Z1NXN8_9PEZI|nr:hypothetical protein E6O75_ATG11285 [Venturia nashicola]
MWTLSPLQHVNGVNEDGQINTPRFIRHIHQLNLRLKTIGIVNRKRRFDLLLHDVAERGGRSFVTGTEETFAREHGANCVFSSWTGGEDDDVVEPGAVGHACFCAVCVFETGLGDEEVAFPGAGFGHADGDGGHCPLFAGQESGD